MKRVQKIYCNAVNSEYFEGFSFMIKNERKNGKHFVFPMSGLSAIVTLILEGLESLRWNRHSHWVGKIRSTSYEELVSMVSRWRPGRSSAVAVGRLANLCDCAQWTFCCRELNWMCAEAGYGSIDLFVDQLWDRHRLNFFHWIDREDNSRVQDWNTCGSWSIPNKVRSDWCTNWCKQDKIRLFLTCATLQYKENVD